MNKFFHLLTAAILLAFSTSALAADKDIESSTYIIGHWNYPANSINPVYVISDGEDVELFINGISAGHGRRESKYLYAFDNIIFQPGILKAVGYDIEGQPQGEYSLTTSGVPAQLKLTVLDSSADNSREDSEEAVIQCEITDFYGKRCFADNRLVTFEIETPNDMAKVVNSQEKLIKIKQLPLHKGKNQISVIRPYKSGEIKITAKAPGLASTYVTLGSK